MAHLRNSPTTIVALSAEPLDVPLHEPFAIATGRITAARNALVRVRLSNGVEGIGEAAPFPPSGGETQETALAAVAGMQTLVEGYDVAQWRTLARRLTASFEHQTTARAGVEAAMLDALARSWGMPLYRYFGEATSAIETDITIPIESPEHMRDLARRYAEQGASTLKIKVGADVDDDLDRVLAVVEGAPDCDIMLDGNQGYTPSEALDLLRSLAQEDVAPILFEQPTHRRAQADQERPAALTHDLQRDEVPRRVEPDPHEQRRRQESPEPRRGLEDGAENPEAGDAFEADDEDDSAAAASDSLSPTTDAAGTPPVDTPIPTMPDSVSTSTTTEPSTSIPNEVRVSRYSG